MTCEECKGACCESMVIGLRGFSSEQQKYFEYHGELTDKGVRLLTKCKHLINGKCNIYPMRPQICRDYKEGSESCKEAIKRFR